MGHIKDRLTDYHDFMKKLADYHQMIPASDVLKIIDELQGNLEQDEKENGWISVSERLPDGDDCRYFMCLLENHLEDVPIFLQYNESVGFGFYTDIYDPVTLGFVDTD